MKVTLAFFVLLLLVFSCKRFEDAVPTSRNTLIHFYGGRLSYEGVKAVEDQDGGYILIGNIHINDFVSDLVVIKTNALGQTSWQKVIPSSSASDIKVVSDGYIITGDSIEYQPNANQISEIVNTRARLLKMDFSQKITIDVIKKDSINIGSVASPVYSQIDFHGNAITFDNSGNIILLGSFKSPAPGSFQKSYVDGLDPKTGALHWTQLYDLTNRDYVNSSAIHLSTSNNLVWATTSERASQSITNAYLSLVCVGVNSIPKANPKYGENSVDHYYTGADIQGSQIAFGVVGTFAKTDGSGSNIYFVRATVTDRTVFMGKATYFDGINPSLADSVASDYQDTGNAIAASQDGSFVLAGSMLSTPSIGSGGKDILLIKVDPFGNFQWNKLIGGTGDEVASSIAETSDGGFLVCGTNTVNGLSTIFLMKAGKDGELKN